MTAIVDTGPLAALAHKGDNHHERATRLMHRVLRGEYGTPVSLDLILLEGLTLLARRTRNRSIANLYASYFHGAHEKREPILQVRQSSDLVERAVELHLQHFERGLSTFDTALIAIAEITDGVIVTFDKSFEGIVPTVTH